MVRIERVLCPNPGPYTGPGTNTWLVSDRGSVLILDPGPKIDIHQRAIEQQVGERQPVAVLVTHSHEDHAPLANSLGRLWDVSVFGSEPGPEFEPDVLVEEGSTIPIGSEEIEVVSTPGHSPDHLCFRLGRVLFSGDHIMGGSSVMVEDLTSYLASLRKLGDREWDRIYPGHGSEIENPNEVINWYVAHRLQREQEILAAMAGGAESVDDIVEVVYREVDRALFPLAKVSVAAHLRKLTEVGPG